MRPLQAIILWGPVAAYCGLLYFLSSISAIPFHSGLSDKVAHALIYAGLGVLCVRATHRGLRPPRLWPSVLAILLAVGHGAFDEWHQSWVPRRVSSWEDWIADAVGALLGWVLVFAITRFLPSPRPSGKVRS